MTQLDKVLQVLEYEGAPAFLTGDQLGADPDFGHIFRRAREECQLRGVYLLRGGLYQGEQSNVPVVYVCEASTDEAARQIHQQVWNQNVVPFLLVVSPRLVRLYSGFRYQRRETEEQNSEAGVLRILRDYNDIATVLQPFRATSIDSGELWKQWGDSVTPETRVDWQLLSSLEALDEWLRDQGIDDRFLTHSIIGKFVYLHYLRQRRILSDRKLEVDWGIRPEYVFGAHARLQSFLDLVDHVDEWLNGSVFPLPHSKIRELGAERLRKVAGVFMGETLGGQLPLGFDVYDFSLIPIETLSVIYEQFLHTARHHSGKSQGKARGAYYTPIPLVNFMLDRLDTRSPLKAGMRVLDPSCGSGAFLVQCFRKLIERQLRPNLGTKPKPSEVRRLLVDHIFGVDTDQDACQIAELSLLLTLLEHVEPPDLTSTTFKLPQLRDRNIFCGNAFDEDAPWAKTLFSEGFDWIVGNPPWIELSQQPDEVDKPVLSWMEDHKETKPVGGNQVAEAFAWRASDLADPDGCVALLLPAMTLFKYESAHFRRKFFEAQKVWSIANFANLAEVLFGGRSRLPAAAFFYSPNRAGDSPPQTVEAYSPMVANQLWNYPGRTRRRKETWSIVINASEIKEIPYRDVQSGEALPWKIAMWGSELDRRLITRVGQRFPTIGRLEDEKRIAVSQGMELRSSSQAKTQATEHHPELEGLKTLDVNHLKRRRYLLHFPETSLTRIRAEQTFVSKRAGFTRRMSVSKPPHVIVGAARTFAVYSEETLVVPARQIGISSSNDQKPLLKALALYLNSDFVAYQEFLTTTQAGIQKTLSTLKSLRSLPVPFSVASAATEWEALYDRFEKEAHPNGDFNRGDLIRELNDLTFDALKLTAAERAAVYDLVHIRLGLTQGKVGQSAVRPASENELRSYAETLRDELDGFVGDDGPASARHRIRILFDGGSGLVEVRVISGTSTRQAVQIFHASDRGGLELEKARIHLNQEVAQWVYFNRNLRVYEGSTTYILKPRQRLHWMVTQAMQDAGEIISETIKPHHRRNEIAAG
jgi:Eco57I restriction-modification methylase